MKNDAAELEPEIEITNPILCDVIERNIQILNHLRERASNRRNVQQKISDAITNFSGSIPFVYLHALWFLVWIGWNDGKLGLKPFDPFPYGLLTMVVSLEAIFLATFVLISQNRLSEEADRRADLALHISLLTERELTRVLIMLDAVQDKLGIENDDDEELVDLEKEVRPEDVLEEIERLKLKQRARKRRKEDK